MNPEATLTENHNNRGAFVSVCGYTTSKGEVADYLINGAPSYANYNERRRAFLVAALDRALSVTIDEVVSGCPMADIGLASKAIQKEFGGDTRAWVASLLADVVSSYQSTIARIDGDAAAWEEACVAGAVAGAEQFESVAPGVKRHLESGELHVSGLLVRKTTLSSATKVSVPRPATVVKEFIKDRAESGLDCPAWVQFRLGSDNWARLAYAGQVVENVNHAADAAASK